jgi:hypothetical protein
MPAITPADGCAHWRKAGIQDDFHLSVYFLWIPACAGMTIETNYK